MGTVLRMWDGFFILITVVKLREITDESKYRNA